MTRCRPVPLLLGALVGASALITPAPANAQAPAAKPKRWTGSFEASGNILYGSASQRVGSTSAMLQWADQSALYKLEAQAGYGDAIRPNTTSRSVIVRNTRLGTTIDLRRRDRISPYTFGTAQSSLQQRYEYRVDAGAGARIVAWRADTVINGFVEEATFSASMLGEQTRPLPTASTPQPEDITRVRWSLRANYKKRISSALRLTHATLYQPSLIESSRYTIEATTVIAAPLYARTELTVTHRERIDTEAVDRGAPSRRDGQVLFGVRTGF